MYPPPPNPYSNYFGPYIRPKKTHQKEPQADQDGSHEQTLTVLGHFGLEPKKLNPKPQTLNP